MIDYVKLKLPCSSAHLKQILVGLGHEIYKRGENKEYASVENLEVYLFSQEVVLAGSLHKFYNRIAGRGDQNYNDFTRAELIDCVNYLSRLLDVNVWSSAIQNIEYGVNVPIASEKILPLIISYKGKEKSLDRSHSGGGRTIEFELSQFYFKIYNKAAQHKLDKPLTRVEIKVIKGQYLERRFGINTLKDLKSPATLFALKKDLLLRTQELLIADSPKESESSEEEELYKDGFNPRYWRNLKIATIKQSHIFRKKWKEFKVYVGVKGLDKVHCNLLRLIDRKWSSLSLNVIRENIQKRSHFIHFLHLGKEEVIKFVKVTMTKTIDGLSRIIHLVKINSP